MLVCGVQWVMFCVCLFGGVVGFVVEGYGFVYVFYMFVYGVQLCEDGIGIVLVFGQLGFVFGCDVVVFFVVFGGNGSEVVVFQV